MQRQSRFRSYALVSATLLWALFYGVADSARSAPQARPSPKSQKAKIDPNLDPANGPVSLPKILNLLELVKQKIQTEARILLIINARGVDFPMTAGNVEQVKAAGATQSILSALIEKSPPLPPAPKPAAPPPPPPPPAGVLAVRCRPAECEVSIQGGPFISTRDSVATISGLKPGEVMVDFRKRGFVSQKRTAHVKTEPGDPVSVELEPDAGTQSEFGTRLFKAMLDAFGGEDAVTKNLASFSANGSVTCSDPAGARTEWNLAVAFQPQKATLDAKSSAGSLKLECVGETCRPQAPGKFLIGKRLTREKAQELETALRQFRTYHLPAVLQRMIATKTQLSARTADVPASAEQHLRVECNGGKYEIVLNPQLLPVLITLESKTGLDSGLSIGLTDYAALGASRYPRMTEIKFPDAKHGVRVQLDQFAAPR